MGSAVFAAAATEISKHETEELATNLNGLPRSTRMLDYFKSIPTHMDFDGQARAENLSRIIVVLFGLVGLVWVYIIQQFSQTVYILGAGLVLATILTVPPWPLYRLKPLKWQKARDVDTVDTKQNSKKKK